MSDASLIPSPPEYHVDLFDLGAASFGTLAQARSFISLMEREFPRWQRPLSLWPLELGESGECEIQRPDLKPVGFLRRVR